ncbi:hypothetical protein K1719_009022 [Acacia pycnantha]|nr:hypothetical protein K1719_009022 [Acacia pycnantha]
MATIESDPKISLHSSGCASSSSSSLSHKFSGLQDLQDSCDKFLQLSATKQVLAQDCSQKWVDELLDGSLTLLDICSTAKDCLLQSKESVYEVRSAIRRRGAEAALFTAGAANYLSSRKNVKKAIQKP